jgi:hypothetical protein
MAHFDPTTGSLLLPVWVAATLAALFVALTVLAVVRSGAIRTLSVFVGLAVVGYAVWASSIVLDRVGVPDRASELRSFEQRAHGLLARTMQPGSTLSCLDQSLGEQLQLGCERVVFGSPENIAAAVSFVSARLSLLVDGLDAAARAGDASYDNVLNMVRSGLERDQFGIVAHVLLQQANCGADQCEALALLSDPNKVRVHLQDKTFETLVKRHADTWGQARPVADVARPTGNAAAVMGATGGAAPVASKYDFPSSNSIPPVSIMNSEPPQQPAASTPGAAAGASAPREARRPPGVRAPVASRATGQEAPAPVQLAPGAPGAPAPAAANAPRSTAQ